MAVSGRAPAHRCRSLERAGCEILTAGGARTDIAKVLDTLSRRGTVQVMVEGGGEVLGSLFDRRLADEVYAFVAPRMIGGREATTPVSGMGPASMTDAPALDRAEWIPLGPDFLLHGYVPPRKER